MADIKGTVPEKTKEKKVTSLSLAAYLCSTVGFILMSVMCVLYIHRCYTLRNAQVRHQTRLEFALDGEPQENQVQGPECATLIQAYGFSNLDEDTGPVPHKTVYSPTSKSCYCSRGKLDLDKIRFSKADSETPNMERPVYFYDKFSCEEVQRFNAYAAVFNGTVAICWLIMMYNRARRKKVKSPKHQCMCADENCHSNRTLTFRAIQAKV